MGKLTTILCGVPLLASLCGAQLVTPRERNAAVYQSPGAERVLMIAQIEPDKPWRLEFSGAEAPVRLPTETASPLLLKFLLPGRDNGSAVFAKVRGPGRTNDGWVEPDKIDISPDPYWKLRPTTLLSVPMLPQQIPAIRAGQIPAGVQPVRCSYLLLVDPEGKVARLRLVDGDSSPQLETAFREFRFPPIRLEGDPAYMVLAIRAEPSARK